MPYITVASLTIHDQLAAQNRTVGRTHYNVSYHHDDGTNWIGIVEEVLPGETEITAAEYETQWQANQTFNINYETTVRIPDAHKAVDAEPTATAADRRASQQAINDALEDGSPPPAPLAGMTAAEKASAHAELDVQLADVQTWDAVPALAVLHAELVRQATDPSISLMASTVEALIGVDLTAATPDAQAAG